jgi:hypothetical protein
MNVRQSSVIRDRAYLDWLRMQPCILTGQRGNDSEAVDPAHIGQAGMGMKAGDDLALPVIHGLHLAMHNEGEIAVIRKHAPDWLLREAFRAYAREQYRLYKREHGK